MPRAIKSDGQRIAEFFSTAPVEVAVYALQQMRYIVESRQAAKKGAPATPVNPVLPRMRSTSPQRTVVVTAPIGKVHDEPPNQ